MQPLIRILNPIIIMMATHTFGMRTPVAKGNVRVPVKAVRLDRLQQGVLSRRSTRTRQQTKQQRIVLVMASLPRSEIKNKDSGNIVTLSGKDRVSVPVQMQTEPGLDLKTYLKNFPSVLGSLQFPLGARCEKVTENGFDITVPRMQFSEIYLQPTSHTTCKVLEGDAVEFYSERATLEGSQQVQALGLSERYELSVRVVMAPDSTSIISDVDVTVRVDLPAPFSFVPKVVIEPLSSAVLQTMSSLFLRAFTKMVAEDYQERCANPAKEEQAVN